MIKKISIKNIQSYRETELELSKGINAIVGSSNNGKTAILRALPLRMTTALQLGKGLKAKINTL